MELLSKVQRPLKIQQRTCSWVLSSWRQTEQPEPALLRESCQNSPWYSKGQSLAVCVDFCLHLFDWEPWQLTVRAPRNWLNFPVTNILTSDGVKDMYQTHSKWSVKAYIRYFYDMYDDSYFWGWDTRILKQMSRGAHFCPWNSPANVGWFSDVPAQNHKASKSTNQMYQNVWFVFILSL